MKNKSSKHLDNKVLVYSNTIQPSRMFSNGTIIHVSRYGYFRQKQSATMAGTL